jgi:hypothetical protein
MFFIPEDYVKFKFKINYNVNVNYQNLGKFWSVFSIHKHCAVVFWGEYICIY